MPTMIRTGLTHSVCKPDCLPLDTAYEITGTGNNMDYYSSCITSENVIHAFINDWSGANTKLYHYWSDNDGKDWTRELIYDETRLDEGIFFASCDIDSSNNIYVVVATYNSGTSDCDYFLIKGTKSGAYSWSWVPAAAIVDSISSYLNDTACSIHVVDSSNYFLCMGGSWLFFYYSPKWWYTTDGGTSWTEEGGGIDGRLLASYRTAAGKIINVKGHN